MIVESIIAILGFNAAASAVNSLANPTKKRKLHLQRMKKMEQKQKKLEQEIKRKNQTINAYGKAVASSQRKR